MAKMYTEELVCTKLCNFGNKISNIEKQKLKTRQLKNIRSSELELEASEWWNNTYKRTQIMLIETNN